MIWFALFVLVELLLILFTFQWYMPVCVLEFRNTGLSLKY